MAMMTALTRAKRTAFGESKACWLSPSVNTPALTASTPIQASGVKVSPKVTVADSATSSGAVPRISG